MGAKIFEILTYFIIYSFLGWIMESIVRSVSEKKIINTGFLKGPVCPIYGIGAIIMLLFLERYQNKPILLFFIAIIVLTTWEYLVGVLLEKIFQSIVFVINQKRITGNIKLMEIWIDQIQLIKIRNF